MEYEKNILFLCLPPQVIFLLCAYITVYMIYGKFRKTSDSENDSFRLEFLLVPVTGLSFLENHSFTALEVWKTKRWRGRGGREGRGLDSAHLVEA